CRCVPGDVRGKVAAGDKSQRTADSYAYHLRQRVLPILGPRRIDKIMTNDLRQMVTAWREKRLAASTINRTIVAMGPLFAPAMKMDGVNLAANPVSKLDSDDRPKRPRRSDPRILSEDEIPKLLKHAPTKYRLLLATALYSGLRTSELLGLQWGDIDFDGGFIC